MDRFKMDRVMRNMRFHIKGLRKGERRLKMKQRRSVYGFCFTAVRRRAGAGHVITPNTIRLPNDMGLVLNCTWDKTLTIGMHCFGFLCMKGKERWCAHCIIDDYVLEAQSFGISFDKGLVVRLLPALGQISHTSR